MSLDVWLKKGKPVVIGGREFIMLPLPVSRLFKVMNWLEENANDVISDVVKNTEPGKVPNPMVLVTRVLSKVDTSQVIFDILSYPKDPDTKQCINKEISKEYIEEYLDIPTAHSIVKVFIELNEIPDIIKNLQSLPVIKKLTDIASFVFGIPFLNSLRLSTDSTQSVSEGSHSPKSTGMSEQTILERQGLGTSQEKPTVLQ